jgi:hypothetical protein
MVAHPYSPATKPTTPCRRQFLQNTVLTRTIRGRFSVISELQISNSYTALPVRPLNRAANQTHIQQSLNHHHADAAILVRYCLDLDPEIPHEL